MARIEIQDQFGRWQRFQTVSGADTSVKLALQRALKTQLAAKSRKARAVDEKTGVLIDMLQG
jgi:hypothetical protein